MTEEESTPLPLAEEILRIDKRTVVTGRVRVRSVTNQQEELVAQDLASESIEVERVPVDREVEEVPQVRQEGDVTIMPIVEEVLFIERRLVLKEEVHIRRVRSMEHIETPVVLRKQEVVVERLEAGDDTSIKEKKT